MADDDDDEGNVTREFSWIFETMSEITKVRARTEQDNRFIKFLLSAGKARALDLFHRLDKDHGGTLTIKEFVFGVLDSLFNFVSFMLVCCCLWKLAAQN